MYRLLDVGEIILASDEVYTVSEGWITIKESFHYYEGQVFATEARLPVRRKIESTKELGTAPNIQSAAVITSIAAQMESTVSNFGYHSFDDIQISLIGWARQLRTL